MWEIKRTEEIIEWIKDLDDDAKEAILKVLLILRELGPALGRPFVDSIKESRHQNLNELRIQNKKRVFRIFFIFDPDRNAILLIGGDKKGDKRFYKKMIPWAETLYEKYLLKLEKENERKKKQKK